MSKLKMDVFNRLKARLAEELESESESEVHQGQSVRQSGQESREELQRQVEQLKEHINKNYFVYVKRLEKRKERIKELDEYAKLLLKDNETLQKDAKDKEKLIADQREQLDTLEGFKSQELAKVSYELS